MTKSPDDMVIRGFFHATSFSYDKDISKLLCKFQFIVLFVCKALFLFRQEKGEKKPS